MQVINISPSRSPEALPAWDPGAGYHLLVFAIRPRDHLCCNMLQNHRPMETRGLPPLRVLKKINS